MSEAEVRSAVEIAVAVAVLLAPFPFLAAMAVGVMARSRGATIGPRVAGIVSFTGGLALGVFLLVTEPLLATLPILVFAILMVAYRWRARRRAQAGWLLAGAALPWTLLWGSYAMLLLAGTLPFEPAITIGAFALGMAPLIAGIVIALAGDPPPAEPSIDAPAGQPGSRSFGSIAAAIREPTLIGPFGQQEVILLVALIVTSLSMPLLIPADASAVIRIGLMALVVAVIGAEVYVRAWPTRSRRAFEAFSWLGEHELAIARRVVGGAMPSSPAQARRWLDAHPMGPAPTPGELAIRIELLIFAERIDDARGLLDLLPDDTPEARFEAAALRDLVDWRAGGDGDLPGLEAAARALEPVDGDPRLRAEVTIAAAKVRRLMADGRSTAGDAIAPLLAVRERLGARADGQLARALRWRLMRMLLLVGLLLGALVELAFASALPAS